MAVAGVNQFREPTSPKVADFTMTNERLVAAAMKMLGVFQGILVVVSALVVFVPTARTPSLRLITLTLVGIVFSGQIFIMWRKGWLTMTPAQLFQTRARSFPLNFLSTLMGLVAMLLVA